MTKHINILLPYDTVGLMNDALIYKKYIEQNGYSSSICHDIKPINNASTIIFLEKIHENIIELNDTAITKVFMPNHELFKYKNQFKLLKYIDIILCKTRIAHDYFKYMRSEHNLNMKIIYTGFTTFIPSHIKKIKYVKDPNLFVILAGTSRFKNVALTLNNWIHINNCFSNLDKDIKLIITCKSHCLSNMYSELEEYFSFDTKKLVIKDNKIVYSNIIIHTEKLDDAAYYELLSKANVAICVSSKEGFGHYINEARYFNTYIITVDAPPMNELVNTNMGYLITEYTKAEQDVPFTKYKLYNVYPNDDKLTAAIKYCIINKNNLPHNSKQFYIKDKKHFKKRLKNKFIKKLK
jgi:glycosyltransferase involved in cell wall biosynthesis